MINKFTLPAPDSVLKEQRHATETMIVCDLPGLYDLAGEIPKYQKNRTQEQDNRSWDGGMNFETCRETIKNGDLSGVEASEKLLAQIENLVPISKAYTIRNDVVGATPNVPEFISGNPYCMRRRIKTVSNTAPLAMFVELVSSAGIGAKVCAKRGAAMLALARMLSNIRPMELWIVIAVGQKNQRHSLCVRLDTSPLDLARAAHMLSHPAVYRRVGYSILDHKCMNDDWPGTWAFCDVALHRKSAKESYVRVLTPGSDVLYVPPVHMRDEYLDQPTQWLTKMLAEHGTLAMAA